MKALAEQLAFYRSYHRTTGCKISHFFGVPLVAFSILIPMGWTSLSLAGHRFTPAMAFVLLTLGYYFLLEPVLAISMTAIMIPLTWAADWTSRLPLAASATVFAVTFAGGWIFQMIGHAIEGRRPALMDNFAQAVFTAPLFLCAEVLTSLGWWNGRHPGEAPGGS